MTNSLYCLVFFLHNNHMFVKCFSKVKMSKKKTMPHCALFIVAFISLSCLTQVYRFYHFCGVWCTVMNCACVKSVDRNKMNNNTLHNALLISLSLSLSLGAVAFGSGRGVVALTSAGAIQSGVVLKRRLSSALSRPEARSPAPQTSAAVWTLDFTAAKIDNWRTLRWADKEDPKGLETLSTVRTEPGAHVHEVSNK